MYFSFILLQRCYSLHQLTSARPVITEGPSTRTFQNNYCSYGVEDGIIQLICYLGAVNHSSFNNISP